MGIGASSFTMEALVEMQIVLEEKPHFTLLIFLCIIQSSVMPLSLSLLYTLLFLLFRWGYNQ